VATRIYFPEDAHEGDPVLSGLSEAERETLIAVREEDGYRFDVRLQGPDETVFFDL
jgi:protocatechuate 3,4-dioxygenase, alpha subunit